MRFCEISFFQIIMHFDAVSVQVLLRQSYHWGIMDVTFLSFLREITLLQTSRPLALTFLSCALFHDILSLGVEGLCWFIHWSWHPHTVLWSLNYNQLWFCVTASLCYKEKLLWWGELCLSMGIRIGFTKQLGISRWDNMDVYMDTGWNSSQPFTIHCEDDLHCVYWLHCSFGFG